MSEEIITSPANQTIKDIRALEMRKRRKETGLFMAEGLRTVIEGMELGAQMSYLVYLSGFSVRADIAKARDYCLACGGRVLEVTQGVLEKISHKDNPQAVVGVFRQSLRALDSVDPARASCWVALENVRDPGNLGTIIRTVDGVGASGVILVGPCCDPYSVEAVRATMGSIFSVPVVTASREDFLEWAKSWPGSVVGTTLQDATDYRSIERRDPLLLLMGSEQAGLSDEMRRACSALARLPMKGRADFLNLSVATGVMLYAMLEGPER